MKLSHSAIPTFSPTGTLLSFLFVVVTGVLAGAVVDGVVSALRFVGAPQASTSTPIRTHPIKRKNLDIEFSLFVGWKSAPIIHLFPVFRLITLQFARSALNSAQSLSQTR